MASMPLIIVIVPCLYIRFSMISYSRAVMIPPWTVPGQPWWTSCGVKLARSRSPPSQRFSPQTNRVVLSAPETVGILGERMFFSYVPMSQLERYFACSAVSVSMLTPIEASLSLPTSSSMSLGTV